MLPIISTSGDEPDNDNIIFWTETINNGQGSRFTKQDLAACLPGWGTHYVLPGIDGDDPIISFYILSLPNSYRTDNTKRSTMCLALSGKLILSVVNYNSTYQPKLQVVDLKVDSYHCKNQCKKMSNEHLAS